jgi:hypothetical protein
VTLGGGQKSRVAFSLPSLQRPHILLLDEVRSSFFAFFSFGVHLIFLRKPTNHLDLEGLDALMLALGAWNGGVIVISHDERFARARCCLSSSTLSSGCVEMVRSQSRKAMWKPIRSKLRNMLAYLKFTELDCQQYQGQTTISVMYSKRPQRTIDLEPEKSWYIIIRLEEMYNQSSSSRHRPTIQYMLSL